MRNRMARRKQYRAAEEELMKVPPNSLREERLASDAGGCPSRWELRRFAAGKCDSSQRDKLLGHLAACDLCIDSLASLRRRWLVRTAFAFASAMVVIATAAGFWVNQHR